MLQSPLTHTTTANEPISPQQIVAHFIQEQAAPSDDSPTYFDPSALARARAADGTGVVVGVVERRCAMAADATTDDDEVKVSVGHLHAKAARRRDGHAGQYRGHGPCRGESNSKSEHGRQGAPRFSDLRSSRNSRGV